MDHLEPSSHLKETPVRHILVWMPNWIGDVVFALPSVQALRKHYPQARITAVARPPSQDFLTHHPDIDAVIATPFGKKAGLFRPFWFALKLRKYRFDLAIVFPNSIRSAFLTYLAKARVRLGYNTEGRGLWLTDAHPVRMNSREVHGVDYYADLLTPLGIEGVERQFPSLVSSEDEKAQGSLLNSMGIQDGDMVIAVSPGASKPEKRWHAERFGILCQRLVKERQARILLLGSKAEDPLLTQIRQFCPSENVVALTGLNLHVVLGILRNCRLLVANDSGLMNLAAMVDTPVVGIFGPGHPRTTDPCIDPGRKELVTRNFPCSPCRHNFFRDCEPSPHQKPFCIEDISVNDVVEAIDRLLEKLEAVPR